MAKIYISFLGTNDYLNCNYYTNDPAIAEPRKVDNIRFVQEATLKIHCRDWTDQDRGYIFVTKEACDKNWLNNGQYDRNNECQKNCSGLKSCIAELNLPFPVNRIEIPEGTDEKQIWDIFEKVFECINFGDEIIFGITHAFRSIPMLAIVILNYAKVLKNVNLIGIYYGAFEALGLPWKVKDIPISDRNVRILDLTAFDQLLDWSLAVDRFLGAGDAQAISLLAKRTVAPVLKKAKGKNQDAVAVKYIADALDTYAKNLATCRGLDITKSVIHLREELEKGKNTDLVKPLHPLFEHIEAQVRPYNGTVVGDGIQAAKWCLEHNLIQQGYTILQETLITHFTIKAGEDYLDENMRNIVGRAASICKIIEKDEQEWDGDAGSYPDITRKFITILTENDSLKNAFSALSELRNDLNHAGIRKQPKKWNIFLKSLDELIEMVQGEIGNPSATDKL